MAKSVEGMQESLHAGGKDGGMKYCQEWKHELEVEGKLLQDKLKSGDIDQRLYNQKRISLNQRTLELNNCINAMNKKFG